MATVRLEADYIGSVDTVGIYRVDLGASGLTAISEITIHDDNVLSGGSGSHSGLDLNFVKLLSTGTRNASNVVGLAGDAALDLSPSGVNFQAGFQTPLQPGDPSGWRTNLQGTSGANVYDPGKATLGTADIGQLSLGEGGRITFLFKTALSTDGRYFYFGDTGANNENAYVLVSSSTGSPPPLFKLIGTAGSDTIRLGVGLNKHLEYTDTIVYGRGGNDKIYGAFGNDRLYGEAGRDYLVGGLGNDRVDGGSGIDRLYGSSGDDWLYGGSGADRLHGGLGDDVVNGGSGNDRLSGSSGSDAFVFSSRLGTSTTDRKVNFDTITDFNVKYDSLWLDNAIFRKLGSGTMSNPGDLNREFFITGSKAREQDDYLIYNKNTGVLSYDADGSGAREAVEFAQLSRNLKLSFQDFAVI